MAAPPIFVVSVPITMTFYTGVHVHHQCFLMFKHEKDLHKINVIDNDIIILKFGRRVASDKTILQIKQKSHKICTDVMDNDVMVLKFEPFVKKHST